jgi:Tfp pilus assembly protein PilF
MDRGGRAAFVQTICAALVLAAGGGCATQRPPVSKLVGGRVVVTRPVDPNAYEHVGRALLYEEEDRPEEAIAELQRALNFDRDAPEVHARLAGLYLSLDKVKEAQRAVRDSLALGETVDGYVAQARLRRRDGDQKGDVASLRQAVSLTSFAEDAPQAIATYLELADAQLMSLDIEGARATLQELTAGAPQAATAHLRLAAVAWALADHTETERHLRLALQAEPNQLDALLMLAWLYTAGGRTGEARDRFAEALERAEGAFEVAAAYARFLVAIGEPAGAADLADDLATAGTDDETILGRIEVERAAHRSDKALALARERRAVAGSSEEAKARLDVLIAEMLADKDPAAAVTSLLGVPRSAGPFVESRLRAASLLRAAGKLPEANRALGEAEAEARTPIQLEEIGMARALNEEKAGAPQQALARLDELASRRPQRGRVRMAKAFLLERLGRWQEALAVADAVVRAEPNSAEALNFWGFVAAEHRHELTRARQRIQAALAFEPGAGAVLDSLGWAHLQAGELAKAAFFLEQAARLEPEDPEVLGHLAELYARNGQRDRAEQALRKALGAKPEDPLRRRLEEQLARSRGK